jgi:hypothetical protein
MAKTKAMKKLSATVPTKNSHMLGFELSAVICETFIPKIELMSEMGTKLTENQYARKLRGRKWTVQICE